MAMSRVVFSAIKDRLDRLCKQLGDYIHEAERALQKKVRLRLICCLNFNSKYIRPALYPQYAANLNTLVSRRDDNYLV